MSSELTCATTDLAQRLSQERPRRPCRLCVRVTGHTAPNAHQRTIATVLRELNSFWGKDC
jgi:hypothetical protein